MAQISVFLDTLSTANNVEIFLCKYVNLNKKTLTDQDIGNDIASGFSKGIIKSNQTNAEFKIKKMLPKKIQKFFLKSSSLSFHHGGLC